MSETPTKPIKFPIGLSDYKQISNRHFYYADKTMFVYELVKEQMPFFLYRPRSFGKSLFLNTISHVLHGEEELFEGLWIKSSDYVWKKYPVLKLSLVGIKPTDPAQVITSLSSLVERVAKDAKIRLDIKNPGEMLADFISELYRKHGEKEKVAVLIDEYDAPITFHIDVPAKAEQVRRELCFLHRLERSRRQDWAPLHHRSHQVH